MSVPPKLMENGVKPTQPPAEPGYYACPQHPISPFDNRPANPSAFGWTYLAGKICSQRILQALRLTSLSITHRLQGHAHPAR